MRLPWNEIRPRAAAFAKKWAGKGYEKGETQLFYQGFFDIFKAPFKTDRERAEHLLGLYEQMVSPLALGAASVAPKRKRKS